MMFYKKNALPFRNNTSKNNPITFKLWPSSVTAKVVLVIRKVKVFEVLVRFPFQKCITSWVFLASELVGLGLDWVGWDLCAGLFYEHCFAMLIIKQILIILHICSMISFRGFLAECLPCSESVHPPPKGFIPYEVGGDALMSCYLL